jgi:hypothetical protein
MDWNWNGILGLSTHHGNERTQERISVDVRSKYAEEIILVHRFSILCKCTLGWNQESCSSSSGPRFWMRGKKCESRIGRGTQRHIRSRRELDQVETAPNPNLIFCLWQDAWAGIRSRSPSYHIPFASDRRLLKSKVWSRLLLAVMSFVINMSVNVHVSGKVHLFHKLQVQEFNSKFK